MLRFESIPNENNSELNPKETERGVDIDKEQEKKIELTAEELEKAEERKRQNEEQINIIREKIKEMPETNIGIDSSRITKKLSTEDINKEKRFLEKSEGVPFSLISTKKFNKLLEDDWNLITNETRIVMRSELKERKSKNKIEEKFLDARRFVGRIPFCVWDKIRDSASFIKGIHFEERTPEDTLKQAEKLKQISKFSSPLVRMIAEIEEEKIKNEIKKKEGKK